MANGEGLLETLAVLLLVKNPAAELRGIKIQNIIALVADTLYNDITTYDFRGSLVPNRPNKIPVTPKFSSPKLDDLFVLSGSCPTYTMLYRFQRTCFHPPSRAGRYSTGIFINKLPFLRDERSFRLLLDPRRLLSIMPLSEQTPPFVFLSSPLFQVF